MRTLAITFFYDGAGIVDEYMFYLVESLKPFVARNIFVSNGPIAPEASERLEAMGAEILIRPNVGFDVWAYKAGIELVGYEELKDFDEILLLNHTFYGPIFPFSEMFDDMRNRKCDFWGITAHKEMIPNPFTNSGVLPRHLNSHFIAVRAPLLHSEDFSSYWKDMPMIDSYVDSVLKHESRFTKHFIDKGYICEVYDDDTAYPSNYPCFINVDLAMERRCPILKRRIFFHDSLFIEQNAIDLPRALQIMRDTSDYDEALIWKNILRTSKLRTLNTNAGLTQVIPSEPPDSPSPAIADLRIAVCAHVYYTDLLDETVAIASNVGQNFDLFITTSDHAKMEEIETHLADFRRTHHVEVRVVEQNRGRDMSSLFITWRDKFLGDDYDLVLRLHTKKSPQVEGGRGLLFKRHMLENLAPTPGFTQRILDMFATQPWLGLVVPPVVHMSYPTLGNAWFANKPRAQEVAKELGLRVEFDESTPIAAYGTMFWFRPKALRKLFAHPWKWEDFNPEPNHTDGGLAHVLERLISYTAQDAGYITRQTLSEPQASLNYGLLEYKLERISSYLPWTFPWQLHMLDLWKKAGHPIRPSDALAKDFLQAIGAGGLRTDSLALAYERIEAKCRRIVTDVCGTKSFTYDPASQNRPDLRFQRHLILSRVSSKIFSFYRFASSHNRGRDGDDSVSEIKRAISVLEDFLTEVRNPVRGRAEKTARRNEILDYILFSWREKHELTALFDSAFYLTNSVGEDVPMNPFLHYLEVGAARGDACHPLFDPAYYVSQVYGRKVENPLVDYLARGWKANLSPHPLFDVPYYLKEYPDVAEHRFEPLSHYLIYGANEGRNPHWAFDTRHYQHNNPEVMVRDVNPLVDFVLRGADKGISPNPNFDIPSYRQHFPEVDATGVNPLIHWVESVRKNLRDRTSAGA